MQTLRQNDLLALQKKRTAFSALEQYITFYFQDDITFPVAGNALPHSEDFTAWTLTGATVSANARLSPRTPGITTPPQTADKLLDDTSTGKHSAKLQATLAAGPGVFSTYAAAGEWSKVSLRLDGDAAGIVWDLKTGVITGSLAGRTPGIRYEGGGYWRCWIQGDVSANPLAEIVLLDDTGSETFTGTGTKGVYLFGAQVEPRVVPFDYAATTTAPVASTSGSPRSALIPVGTYLFTNSVSITDLTNWHPAVQPFGTRSKSKTVAESVEASLTLSGMYVPHGDQVPWAQAGHPPLAAFVDYLAQDFPSGKQPDDILDPNGNVHQTVVLKDVRRTKQSIAGQDANFVTLNMEFSAGEVIYLDPTVMDLP